MTCFGAFMWRACPRGAGALMAAGWVAVWCGVTGGRAAAGEASGGGRAGHGGMQGERLERGGVSLLVEKSRYRLNVAASGCVGSPW